MLFQYNKAVPAVTLFAENGPPDRFLFAQTPSLTRTNDLTGQKHRSPCSLGALRIAPCFFLRKTCLFPPLAAAGLAPVNSRAAVNLAGSVFLHKKNACHKASVQKQCTGAFAYLFIKKSATATPPAARYRL